jgi:hypothetical protein
MTPEKTEEIEAKKALVAKKFEGIIAPLEARFQFYKKTVFLFVIDKVEYGCTWQVFSGWSIT